MSSEQQLAWEARAGRTAALAAVGGAVFSLAAGIVPPAIIGDRGEGTRGALLALDSNGPQYIVVQVLQALALIFTAVALLFLLRCTIARRPEVPRLVVPLVMVGPLLGIVGGVLSLIEVSTVADTFAASGERSEKRAEDLLGDASPFGSLIGLAGSFCIAVSFVLTGLNAMRAGLLSRFMGVLGVLVGALLVLGLGPVQSIVQAFWLGALAALFLDRWPKGRGPAWGVVEPVPWPSAREASRGEQAGAIPADDPTIEPAADGDEPARDASDPRAEGQPTSKKRKRKRRR